MELFTGVPHILPGPNQLCFPELNSVLQNRLRTCPRMPLDQSQHGWQRDRDIEFEERSVEHFPGHIFACSIPVWLSGTREFNMQPQTWQKVGTKVESAVSCPGGGPFLEEGWHPGTRGDG